MDNENAFERWEGLPKKQISLHEVVRVLKEEETSREFAEKRISWYEQTRQRLQSEFEALDFSLSLQIDIAEGNKLIIAVPVERWPVFQTIFEIDLVKTSALYKARITANNQTVEARLVPITFGRSSTSNHLIVSKGLVSQLQMKPNDSLIITDVYQDTSSINLDKLV